MFAAAIPALGSLAGSIISTIASSDAADDMKQRMLQALGLTKEYYQQGREALAPFQGSGVAALPRLQEALSQMEDPAGFINRIQEQYKESPGAKFQLQQGLEAAQQGAEAGGTLGSGAQQKALTRFGEGVASQDEGKYLGDVLGLTQERLGGLESEIGTGLSAGGQQANLAANMGQNMANLLGQTGQIEAAGDVARGEGGEDIVQILTNALGNRAAAGGTSSPDFGNILNSMQAFRNQPISIGSGYQPLQTSAGQDENLNMLRQIFTRLSQGGNFNSGFAGNTPFQII
jgi:hypothetical protein